ncbi:MAG: hypothetical protein O2821_05655 [Chloroflexi bacterium]|nr:hypothetical protein [Chloroflexota bacterium]
MEHMAPVTQDTCIWRTDWRNNITFINQAWMEFAVNNGAPNLPARVLDTNLLDNIIGDEVKRLTNLLLERVRATDSIAVLPFQCDSPEVHRLMDMVIIPLSQNSLEFRSHIVRQEDRETLNFPQDPAAEPKSVLVSCSWCNRIESHDQWLEVENAIRVHRLFEQDSILPMSHTICPECRDSYFGRQLN